MACYFLKGGSERAHDISVAEKVHLPFKNCNNLQSQALMGDASDSWYAKFTLHWTICSYPMLVAVRL